MNYKPNTMYAALSFSLLVLTACGGGDNGDVQPPSISLIGENPMLVAHGADFSDPGASVTDNIDINLSVIISGSVDTHTLGSYNLTYSAVDNAGNTAEVSRVVNVTDQTAPEIMLIGEAEVSVEQNSSFTDLGSEVSDNIDDNLVATVSGSVDLSKVGSYTLTYDVSDAAGNAAMSIERTVVVTAISGQLSDIVISGLAYTTATQSGVTDEEGKYLYQVGENIQFSLGDTLIGDAVTANKALALTDLLPDVILYTTYGQLKNLDKLPDYHSDKVAFFRLNNTLSLLMSVDDDSNPANGINIPDGLLPVFTGEAIDLEQHFFYLAGKGRRWGEGDKQLKHILQPAAAQGLLDSGDIIGHGIALDNYYRLNNISHNLQIQTGSSVDIDADGNVDGINEEHYSELGDRIRSVEDHDNDGITDYIANYSFDEGGRRVSFSVDSDGDGVVNRHGYYRYDANANQIMYESDSNADGVIDSRSTEEYDVFGNSIRYNHDSDADGVQDSISAYTYDVEGNEISQSYDQDGDGQVDEISDSTFDSKGNRLSSTSYSGDDRAKITTHNEYSYDERNNQTSSRNDWDGDGQVDNIEKTTYDLNGNQLVVERDEDGSASIDRRYSYAYDADGNQIFASFEEVGVNTGLYYYTFDDKANRLTHDGDDDGDGTIDYRFSSTFDTEGNQLTQEYDFDNNGAPEQIYTYTYNSFGNMESETQDKDGDGAADKITIYTHEPSNFRAVLYDLF